MQPKRLLILVPKVDLTWNILRKGHLKETDQFLSVDFWIESETLTLILAALASVPLPILGEGRA